MVIGYMLTWTTYGSWLQGDKRGWVKDGKIYSGNPALENANRQLMKAKPVTLTKNQRIFAAQAIINKATKLNQKLFALAVCDNHIHIVLENTDLPVGRVVSYYKNAARVVLQEQGFQGKLWTRGFDKRYCMNTDELNAKIAYVQRHKNLDAEIIINNS